MSSFAIISSALILSWNTNASNSKTHLLLRTSAFYLFKRIDYEEYALLRYAFITPKHIPSISETKLRGDFDFSQYLAGALDKTLRKAFNTGAVSYIGLAVMMMIWLLMLKLKRPLYRVQFTIIIGDYIGYLWSIDDLVYANYSNDLQWNL